MATDEKQVLPRYRLVQEAVRYAEDRINQLAQLGYRPIMMNGRNDWVYVLLELEQ